MAQSFNEETRRPQGEPVPLRVQVGPLGFGTQFSVSATGRLVFASPSGSTSQLTWLDRTTGRPVGIVGDQGIFNNLDLSPDGQRVAVDKLTPRPGGVPAIDIWVIDLATGIATPVTDDPANDFDPAWSPDGKHIVFNSNRLGGWSLFMRPSDGSGGDMPLLKSGTESYTVAAWSGANDLVFNVFGKNNPDGDLWTLSMSGDRTPKAYVTSKHAERNGAFSLDGRWVAYQSNASGRSEIVVRPFPSKGPAQPVSRNGGAHPRWRGDGKELFFLSPEGTMMAVGFDATNGVPEGVPRALFPAHIRGDNSRPYAVARNGDRFLLPIVADAPLRVVTDWRALLNR
jgi:Tol biopolymer transport system component